TARGSAARTPRARDGRRPVPRARRRDDARSVRAACGSASIAPSPSPSTYLSLRRDREIPARTHRLERARPSTGAAPRLRYFPPFLTGGIEPPTVAYVSFVEVPASTTPILLPSLVNDAVPSTFAESTRSLPATRPSSAIVACPVPRTTP